MHLLLIRFSALGDILMTVPVIKALAVAHPDIKITVVSRPFVASIFALLPRNVHFLGINPRDYKGMRGLNRMYRELAQLHPTHICDLHDVLRTKFLRWRFRLSGLPVTHIHKNRRARKQFITQPVKVQQKTSFEKYWDALPQAMKASTPLEFHPSSYAAPSLQRKQEEGLSSSYAAPSLQGGRGESLRGESLQPRVSIGIAPFAAHQGKIYPLDLMEQVVRLLCERGAKVYLFGAGDKERALMEEWESRYEGATSLVGKLRSMAEELKMMTTLSSMLTMDSGNMHLAALTGVLCDRQVPVYSIWGATHPLGGFLGWGQTLDSVIQLPLDCRPCSTYGKKPCRFGDYRCLRHITPEDIVSKLLPS